MKNNVKFFRFFVYALLVVFIASGKQQNPVDEPLSADVEVKLSNVSYGSDQRNVMDVYLPANRTAETPLAILIHGGGWVSGDKFIFTALQDTLLARGIASVNINYRYVSPTVHCDQLMEDIHNVVKYCVNHSQNWQVNAKKMVIGGHSAGGHMSLMYAYTADTQGVIGGVISVSGPTNLYDENLLNDLKNLSLFFPVFIQTLENLANAKYMQGQPIHENFVKVSPIARIKNVPTLMIHGTKDELVFFETIKPFEAELIKRHVPNRLHAVTDGDHSFTNITLEQRIQMHSEMANWIKMYSK